MSHFVVHDSNFKTVYLCLMSNTSIRFRLISLGILFFLSFQFNTSSAQLGIGATAPEIRLPDSLGKWKPLSEVNGKLILIDFWAAWCGPCRIMNPIIDELAEIFEGRAKIAKLNVDEEDELALQYHVHAIPTLILFQKGERMETIEGVVAKDLLEAKLTALLPPSSPAAAAVE